VLAFGLQMTTVAPVRAQGPSAKEIAAANNPLADIRALNLHNYYVPKLFDVENQTANTFWLRGVMPTGPVLWRASLPLQTVPPSDGRTTSSSGVGDFNIFAAYLAVQKPGMSFGIGPLLVAPTATEDELGAGKWQLGIASVVFSVPSPALQVGALVTWQASVGGDSERPDTSVLTTQIFSMWQLGGGTYLRSTPIWVFDLRTGNYNIPFGIGIGKVLKVDKTVFNIFFEPQFTILYQGVGQPAVQIFSGLNLQFN